MNLSQKIFRPSILLFFTLCVLLLLPWIFFDIDLGDQGFSSVQSWLMAFHPNRSLENGIPLDNAAIYFSLFVDSLWWKIIGPSSPLIFSRMGWVLWNAAIATTLFVSFSKLYNKKSSFIAMLLTLILVNCAADHFVLTYNSVAPALAAVCVALFALSTGLERYSRKLSLILAGIFCVFAIHARIPSAPFIALFLFSSFLLDLIFKKNNTLSKYIFFTCGTILGLALAIFQLKHANHLADFIGGLTRFFGGFLGESDGRYSQNATFGRALGHYKKIAIGSSICLFVIVSAYFVPTRLYKLLLTISLLAFSIFCLTKYGIALSIFLGAPLLIFSSRILQTRSLISPAFYSLVIGGLMIAIGFTFGTNLEGLQSYKYGLWIWFPVAFLEIENLSISKIQISYFKKLFIGCAFLLFLLTRLQWPTFPYPERVIFSMNTPFHSSTLNGIYSYSDKEKSIDDLALNLEKLGVKPGDQLLVYSAATPFYPICTIYSVTRTIPYFYDPAIVEYPGARWEKNKAALQNSIHKKTGPDFVVRQKHYFPRFSPEPRNFLINSWISNPAPTPFEKFRWENIVADGPVGELDHILKDAGYELAWENTYFMILQKKKL